MGDHASPISDTTVLASVGADCVHINHVTTQGAYALLTGAVTVLAYLLGGIYETPLVLGVAIVVLVVVFTLAMRLFGEVTDGNGGHPVSNRGAAGERAQRR